MKKLLIAFLMILASSFMIPIQQAAASDNFTTAYDVTYDIDEAGTAHVLMKVSLKNTSSQYFASSYKLHVGFDEIENVKAKDPDGEIKPVIEKTDEGHSIGVTFNKHVVGKDKSLPFTVTFDTKDVAQKRGDILSVNIPGIADQEGFSEFTVHVVVPPSFGKPAFIKPIQPNQSLDFTKEQLGTGGISLAFGVRQAYDFFLTYHLRNKNVFPIRTEIALPPDTNYQDVVYTSIEPKPENVTIDKDGNWLASYELKPSESIDVIARGKATLTLTPKKQPESDVLLNEYLKPDMYWDTGDEKIRKLAQKLKTPEAIYDYVIDTLNYDFTRVTDSKARLGAAKVLANPNSAVCLEFTDLFITLARAAGIPAREVNGYAYTENDRQRPLSLVKDILHAWPEYYDREKQTWVMIDPTWGNTTDGIDYFSVLDFDHFAFVRKGIDSEYPVPAGGYKYSESDEGKDVHVEFGKTAPTPREQLHMQPVFADRLVSGLPVTGKIIITNNGAHMSTAQTAIVTSSDLKPSTQTIQIPAIPPLGKREIMVTFQSLPFLTNASHTFTIQFAGKRFEQTIQFVPVELPDWRIIGGTLFGILSISIFIFALKTRRIPFLR